MKQYQVHLKGLEPILHGRVDTREEKPPRRGTAAAEKWYDAGWEFTHYADENRILGQPSHILKAALVAGLVETSDIGKATTGKTATRKFARALMRIEPSFPKFNGGTAKVPDHPIVLDPTQAHTLNGGDPLVFVLRRMSDRGVMIQNLGIANWDLSFKLTIAKDSQHFFDDDDRLLEGLEFGFGIIGMGTWRPDFGIAEVSEFNRI